MNTFSHSAEQTCVAFNPSFNSKKEFIKHSLTNEHLKQSERYLSDKVDVDVSAQVIA